MTEQIQVSSALEHIGKMQMNVDFSFADTDRFTCDGFPILYSARMHFIKNRGRATAPNINKPILHDNLAVRGFAEYVVFPRPLSINVVKRCANSYRKCGGPCFLGLRKRLEQT